SNMSKPSIMLESAMVMSLLAYIPLFLIYFGLIRAVSDNYLGRDVRFADVIRPTTRLWGMVGACILAVLATYCAFLPLAVVMPILVFAKISLGWLAVPAIAILVLVCIMWIHWSVANSAAVIEGKGSVGSLARSVQLVRGFSWKAFFVIVGAFVIYCLVAIVAECILGAILFPLVGVHGAGLIGFGGASGFSAIAIGELIRVIAAMIGMPIVLLPLVLFYYDLRVRKEAFDLQMLAEQLGYGYQEVAPDLQHIV
ncbi:MAG TPA: hypothetical protein VFJ58_09425, partial [Armatimonadota bacterium]|nr:hypothetical protein [Armatimonadota bacterium]